MRGATAITGGILVLFGTIAAVSCLKCYACGFGDDGKGCAEELTSDMETTCPANSKSCVKSEALDSDTAVTRRRCGVEAASEECVEAHDGTNKITLCSCDSGDLCNGSPAPSAVSTSAIYTAALFALAAGLAGALRPGGMRV